MVADPPPLLEAMLILVVQHLELLHSPCLSKCIDLDVQSILYSILISYCILILYGILILYCILISYCILILYCILNSYCILILYCILI